MYGLNDERVGDHILDATFLAVLGFVMEGTQYGKPTNAKTIKVTNTTLRGHKPGSTHEIGLGNTVAEPENMAAVKEQEMREVIENGGKTTKWNHIYHDSPTVRPPSGSYTVNRRNATVIPGFNKRGAPPKRSMF